MINEREEFLSYINFPEYTSYSKTDYGYLGRFTFEMFEDLTGFNRVLTIQHYSNLHLNPFQQPYPISMSHLYGKL